MASGSGTAPSSGATCDGLVPHDTWGTMVAASKTTSLSKTAPSSVARARQSSRACSHVGARGAWARPSSQAKVVSSGLTMPALAPASIDMLQTVIRPSIDRARMAEPRYSMTWPMPPPVPMRPMMARMTSLAVTPAGRSPSTVMAMVPGRRAGRVWVARTCSTSLVPMPKARAPKAPWVEVWLSPHTMVMPGWVRPCSGPMTWTMPCPGVPWGRSVMPNSAQLAVRAWSWRAEMGSARGRSRPMVGVLWSTVATVRSGRRTVRPARRRPSKAWGVVTSWMRCRSM